MVEAEKSGSPLFRAFLGADEAGAPTSIKLVSTSLDGDPRAELEAWAEKEKRRGDDTHAFQIVPSTDKSRDDLINISLGWPLWLLKEVRADWDRAERVRTSNPRRFSYSLIMNEFPETHTHTFRPMEPEEVGELYGVALVLRHVRPSPRLDRIDFEIDAFGAGTESIRSDDNALHLFKDAQARFEQGGLARSYKGYLERRQETEGGIGELKQQIIDELALRRQRVDDSRENLGAECAIYLSKLYDRAEAYATRLTVL